MEKSIYNAKVVYENKYNYFQFYKIGVFFVFSGKHINFPYSLVVTEH